MDEALGDLISAKRLCWLGHVSRMKDTRLPKKLLFGWLQKRRPAHGTKMRWRDKVRKDMKKFNIKDDEWCLTAQDRRVWRTKCKECLKQCTQVRLENDRRWHAAAVAPLRPQHDVVSNRLECDTCHRSFRRKQNIERHKCQRSRDVH